MVSLTWSIQVKIQSTFQKSIVQFIECKQWYISFAINEKRDELRVKLRIYFKMLMLEVSKKFAYLLLIIIKPTEYGDLDVTDSLTCNIEEGLSFLWRPNHIRRSAFIQTRVVFGYIGNWQSAVSHHLTSDLWCNRWNTACVIFKKRPIWTCNAGQNLSGF